MKKLFKHKGKLFLLLGIITPIITVSCSNINENNNKSTNHWKEVTKEQLPSYYEDIVKPKTLLNGTLEYNPLKFDKLKKEALKKIKIKEEKGGSLDFSYGGVGLAVHQDFLKPGLLLE